MKRAALATLALVLFNGTCAAAQHLRDGVTPAEFPPASYKGNQYVDSKGCVYIRAGISGNVTWVPRGTRDRRLVCGFKPSLEASDTAVAEAPSAGSSLTRPTVVPQAPAQDAQTNTARLPTRPSTSVAQSPVPQVEAVTAPKVAQNGTSSAASATTPLPVNRQSPNVVSVQPSTNSDVVRPVTKSGTLKASPGVETVAQKPTVAQTKTATKTKTTFARPKVVAPRKVTMAQAEAICGASKVSAPYINSDGKRVVRCGPQKEAPVTVKSRRLVKIPATAAIPVSRKPISDQQIAQFAIPKGYVSIWDDDRLNPFRGPQTAQGLAQMRLVWTDEVPRRLIDQTSGQDVTALNPKLRYPYTDFATQLNDQKTVKTRASKSSSERVSTKSVPVKTVRSKKILKDAAARTSVRAAKPFLQVGMYGVPANAQRAAKRLQSVGLPARVKSVKRNGKSVQIVFTGPFRVGDDVKALARAKKVGFHAAYLRR